MNSAPDLSFAGSHDPVLVAISLLIAVVASFTALDLAGRVRAGEGRARRLWLAAAAVAMGGGIWAMHFVAMLAFVLPGMAVAYDFGLTALSLVVAIVATGVAFTSIYRSVRPRGALILAGLLMGGGVAAMHYIGMSAMRMGMAVRYDPMLATLSVLIAIGAATAALWLSTHNRIFVERIGAALLMGVAIAGMHYTGMAAATFTRAASTKMADATDVGRPLLALSVATATFLILFLALVAAMFDRRFALLAEREASGLRESEERFRTLYHGTPLPLHSLDRQGNIERVSDMWLQLLGYPAEEVIGRPFINFMTEASARQRRQHDWPELLERGAISPREYRIVTKDGRFLDIVCTARVEYGADGSFRHVLGGITDVTERKVAEEALRQAQKIEAIGQLTGGVAHDFNNLLAVIIGNLELLRKRVSEDERAARYVASALEGAQRGAALTQRLLAFARRQDLRPEAVDVPELVRGMTDMLQRSLGPMIRVETHFPLRLPAARADAHQLEMAILNLAVNARDAMPDGGLLDISASDETVGSGEGGLVAGRYVRLTLGDSGQGMDAETLARAVDPFFTTKGVGKGTGLGLSMVQGLAAQSGGRLLLKSKVGQGTVAALYLPVADDPAARANVPAQEGEIAAMPPCTVLVVDDDPLVLTNTAALLEDLGHRPITAGSGAEALDRLIYDAVPDLVVTDQLMPGMTGLELIARIRADRPGLPVLLVSGYADLAPADAPDVHLLTKPFTQRSLAQAVRAALGGGEVIPLRRRS
ncbi:MHYT domain-containing protein [Sphingomonas sp. BIUV-7]|uniref:histidine kinase n=1 Tax=Sphingomonas natans TaxID=3063330 RepID=A0ABT8Y8M5_9SPHN|nr:MHYT domain-containing protein [Sphingomonas sp. BIUV-7]MDO6414683.1 MHYT domain-containing protein [Sphingomonas sp. BIUV-7]